MTGAKPCDRIAAPDRDICPNSAKVEVLSFVSSDYLIRVLKPTATCIRRQDPERVSAGDSAQAVFECDMLDLLASPLAGSDLPLGAGVLPETITALSAAGTACYLALGDQEAKGRDFDWLSSGLELTWARSVNRGEQLVGSARLKQCCGAGMRFDVETTSAVTGEPIMSGEIEFVPVRGGRVARLTDGMLVLRPRPDEDGDDERQDTPQGAMWRLRHYACRVVQRLCRGSTV